MEMIAVTSSNLAAIGYDSSACTLRVQFNHGGIYDYYSVPQELYEGLLHSGSKGTFLNEQIKKAGYSYDKVG